MLCLKAVGVVGAPSSHKGVWVSDGSGYCVPGCHQLDDTECYGRGQDSSCLSAARCGGAPAAQHLLPPWANGSLLPGFGKLPCRRPSGSGRDSAAASARAPAAAAATGAAICSCSVGSGAAAGYQQILGVVAGLCCSGRCFPCLVLPTLAPDHPFLRVPGDLLRVLCHGVAPGTGVWCLPRCFMCCRLCLPTVPSGQ
jgi:hypothetical protein